MFVVLSLIILVASVLLVGIILIQKSKGGGLAANVNNYNQFMGVRKTTDFVEKATWTLFALIVVLSIVSSFIVTPTMVQGAPQIQKVPLNEQQGTPFGTASQGASQQGGSTAPTKAPATSGN